MSNTSRSQTVAAVRAYGKVLMDWFENTDDNSLNESLSEICETESIDCGDYGDVYAEAQVNFAVRLLEKNLDSLSRPTAAKLAALADKWNGAQFN